MKRQAVEHRPSFEPAVFGQNGGVVTLQRLARDCSDVLYHTAAFLDVGDASSLIRTCKTMYHNRYMDNRMQQHAAWTSAVIKQVINTRREWSGLYAMLDSCLLFFENRRAAVRSRVSFMQSRLN